MMNFLYFCKSTTSFLPNLENSNIRADSLEDSLELAARGADHTAGKRELNVAVVELLDVGTLGVSGLNSGSLNDLDTTSTNAMARTHLLVELLYGTVQGEVAVLLVGVVDTGTRVVANPDAKVLNGGGILLEDLIDSQNLTVGLLYTSELS